MLDLQVLTPLIISQRRSSLLDFMSTSTLQIPKGHSEAEYIHKQTVWKPGVIHSGFASDNLTLQMTESS